MDTTYEHELEAVLIDILEGQVHEIQAITGLDDDRCDEIEKLFYIVLKKYNERNGL